MCMLNGKTSFPIPNVLTAYYEDIKGIVCASGCTKSKVVKRKFEDQDNIPAPSPAPAPAPRHRPRQRPRPRHRRRPPGLPAGRAHLLRGGASSGPQPCWQGRQGGKGNRGW